jgi:hypothetical protein
MQRKLWSEDDRVACWTRWVEEMEDYALDPFEYLEALSVRDDVEMLLQVTGDQRAVDVVVPIDARFEALTETGDRFAMRFATQAGEGWWWSRVPADPGALAYLFEDQ